MKEHENQQEKYTPIRSIAEAEQRLSAWDSNNESTADFPNFIINAINNQTEVQLIYGDSDDYHNLAAEFARKDLYKHAESAAIKGTEKYRYNVDLLADVVKYGSQSQDWDACKGAYDRLRSISFRKWTWRCFTFSIDYHLDLIENSDPSNEEKYTREVYELITAYKQLNNERAWVAEAELLLSKGERNKAIDTLKNAIQTVCVSPQSCLRLSDLLLEDGKYSEVIRYSAIGLRATAQEQPSASNGYLLYISALAKDAIIHQEEVEIINDGVRKPNKGFSNIAAVKSALLDYETAKQLLQGRPIYLQNIVQREAILQAKSGVSNYETKSRFGHTFVEQYKKHLRKKKQVDIDSDVELRD